MLFQCLNLCATLENGRTLIPTLNFTMDSSDKLAIIAEEGNGKSTLLKRCANIPISYVRFSGTIQTDCTIGYLSQTIEKPFLKSTPLEYLFLKNPNDTIQLEQYNDCQSLEQICRSIHIDPNLIYENRMISTLSGGEKVRLQLLKLISQKCDLYCLDEPTNDLDIDTLEWLETWMLSQSKPIIFVSHDVHLLSRCASRILHLEQRNKKTKPIATIFNGSYEQYIQARQQQRTKNIQISKSEKREYLQQKQRLNDLHNKVQYDLRHVSRQAPSVAKNLKDKMRSIKSSQSNLERKSYLKLDSYEEEIHMFFHPVHIPATKLIYEQNNQSVCIDNKTFIQPFDFQLYGQDKIAITGKNGCGKSVWMQSIVNALQNRQDIKVGYMPQNYEIYFKENDTPISFLQKETIPLTDVQTLLGNLKLLDSEMKQSIFHCSEGQKAKIYFASLILNKCDVLLLDEPTRNISPLSLPVFIRALQQFNGCILCISHDRYFIEAVFPCIMHIENGAISLKSKRNH